MKNHKMPDPSLTPLGEEQSGKLQKTFPHHDSVELLVSSPIRRALYTTLIGFESDVQRGLKVIALPDVQETSDHPCDTGSNPDKLEEEFGKGGRVDLSLVHEGWNVKVGGDFFSGYRTSVVTLERSYLDRFVDVWVTDWMVIPGREIRSNTKSY